MPTQREIDSTLRWGIIFSVFWLAGIGSLIAVLAGLKAKRQIASSGSSLKGAGRAWWCLIFGGFGLAVWVPIFFFFTLYNLGH